MNHTLLLGADDELGQALMDLHCEPGDWFTGFDAKELDMAEGWLLQVKEGLRGRVPNTVIINMFDEHYDRLGQQLRVFKVMWDLFPKATFVVINSALHHYVTIDRSQANYAYQQVFSACAKLAFSLDDRRLYVPELVRGTDVHKVAQVIRNLVRDAKSPQFMQFCIKT